MTIAPLKPRWRRRGLRGVVRVGNHLYGSGHEARGWFCLDFATGRSLWQAPGKGALTYADGRLYCVDEKGDVSLVRCTPEKWDAVSSFRLPRGGKGSYWAHPVVCGGRLYLRHSDQLFAYDITAKRYCAKSSKCAPSQLR